MAAESLCDTLSRAAGTATVKVGRFVGFDSSGYPLVEVGGDRPVRARVLGSAACGLLPEQTMVLLIFEDGDPASPIIAGSVHTGRRESDTMLVESESCRIDVRSKTVSIEAREELQIRCGAAALILHKDGKLLLRGERITSRARITNKIKGGSVQIN
jgi:hypothetical protein